MRATIGQEPGPDCPKRRMPTSWRHTVESSAMPSASRRAAILPLWLFSPGSPRNERSDRMSWDRQWVGELKPVGWKTFFDTDGYPRWIKDRFPKTGNALRAVLDRWVDEAVNREYDRVR